MDCRQTKRERERERWTDEVDVEGKEKRKQEGIEKHADGGPGRDTAEKRGLTHRMKRKRGILKQGKSYELLN